MERSRSRRAPALIAMAALVFSVLLPVAALAAEGGSVAWRGQGSDSQECHKADGQLRDAQTGWIHWVFTTGGRSSVTNPVLVVNGTFYDEPASAGNIQFYTPYVDLDELEATVHFDGALGRGRANLVISDYCQAPDEPEDPPVF